MVSSFTLPHLPNRPFFLPRYNVMLSLTGWVTNCHYPGVKLFRRKSRLPLKALERALFCVVRSSPLTVFPRLFGMHPSQLSHFSRPVYLLRNSTDVP